MENLVIQTDDVIWRRIEDEIVLIKDNGLSTHVLNKTAAFIWELCDGENGVDDIARRLCDRFDVSFEIARRDVRKLIDNLLEVGVLKAAGEKVADER
jgi:hypothetical protein